MPAESPLSNSPPLTPVTLTITSTKAWRQEKPPRQPADQLRLAPHAPYTVSDKTFERILTLSEQLNLPIHCHIHETRQEMKTALKQNHDCYWRDCTNSASFGPGFIGVHAVHLSDSDLHLFADTGSNIAHCPTSNLKLASGFAPVARMRQFGINVGLRHRRGSQQ